MLRDLWSNLCGITIDSLTACDDQIIINISQSAGNCCRSCPCISTTEYTVCYKNTLVSTHSKCFTKNFLSLWKTHCKNGYFHIVFAHIVFNSECCFQTSFIVRVHDGKHSTSVQSTVRIKLNSALCIWNLLNTNYYFHSFVTPCLLFLFSESIVSINGEEHQR